MKPMPTWNKLFGQLECLLNKAIDEGVEKYKEEILAELRSNRAGLSDFETCLTFDDNNYSMNLIKNLGEKGNVILIGWQPNQTSRYHSHEGSKCFVKVISGSLNEMRLPIPRDDKNSSLLDGKERTLVQNEVTYIDDSIGLHKMMNPSETNQAVSLHIYLPPYKRSRIFDSSSPHLSFERSAVIDLSLEADKSI